MTVKYKTVITKAGAIKLAAATVPNGKKVNFTAMAVGDGGGTLPVPDPNQTKLVKEVWRHALNKISQDRKNKNYVVAELLIPPETGGFWMRELGLYDDTGTLIAVGNMAESYKPALAEGSGRAQTVRMVIMVSDIESVELTIDTSTVMATQDYVDDKLAEHEKSRRHPDATLTAKGFTQLSSATDSTSESVAATPKAVKAAYDLAKGKYTAQDATTAQKGIVQLSSATDSTSESVAATPKAIKAAYDLAKGKYTAQDASTAQKGIVQLSSMTDSTSETLAATPKAVKAAYDLATGKYTAQDATTGRKGIVQLSNATNSTSETLAATPKAVSTAINEMKETLGTASGANIVTSMTDTTAGRVPVVGWMGWGVGNSGSGCPVSGGIDYVSEPTGIWQTTNENTTGTFPPNVSHYGTLYRMRGSANDVSQLYFPGASVANGGNIYYRQYNAVSMTWGGWYKIYSEFSKPTASDVDAVSASQGGTFQRAVTFNQGLMSRGKIAWGDYANAVGSSAYNAMVNVSDSTGKTRWAFGPYVNSWSIYAYNSDGSYKGNVVSIDFTTFNAAFSAQVVPGNYANFDARYQPKGSYTPAGQAYTKAESDARYQLKNTSSRGANGWFKDTSTGMIFQWGTITLPASGYRTTSAAFSFPITFPNAALNLQTTPASAGVSNNGYLAVTACTSLSASGGTIYADSNNGESFSKTQTVRYFAVGY
ncbi:TPA: tail fiber protein [Enterobacter cloacae]